MWLVIVTTAGEPHDPAQVRAALERLAEENPFLLTARYGADRAEVRYWEEAPDIHDAAAMALRLWGEHRKSAGLPAWKIMGLEIVEQEILQRRSAETATPAPLAPAGGVRPFTPVG